MIGYGPFGPNLALVQVRSLTASEQCQRQRALLSKVDDIRASLQTALASLGASSRLTLAVPGLQQRLIELQAQGSLSNRTHEQWRYLESSVDEVHGMIATIVRADRASFELAHADPPLRRELGREKLASLRLEAPRLLDDLQQTSKWEELQKLARRLANISDDVFRAKETIVEQANPLSELNIDIDKRLLFAPESSQFAAPKMAEQEADPWMQVLAELPHPPPSYSASRQPAVRRPPVQVAGQVGVGLDPEIPATRFDLCVSFENDTEGRFRGTWWSNAKKEEVQHFRVNIRPSDLATLNEQLRGSLDQIVTAFSAGNTFTAETMRNDLEEVVRRGQEVLERILPQGLIARLTDGSRPVKNFLISAEDFFLPWEMLALPVDEGRTEERLLGFRYNICRSVLDAGQPLTRPELITDQRPDVSLLAAREDSSGQFQLFNELENGKWIELNALPELDPAHSKQELLALPEFWRRRAHIFHAGCHAVAQQGSTAAYLRVDRDFHLSIVDLKGQHLVGSPLVVLNACNTGVNPRSAADFVRVFLHMGACGVIATEYDVPESFAAEFAREFYLRFLRGQKVGEALRGARRFFLNEHHNPLGMLYSAYVEPDVRLNRVVPTKR